MSVLSQEDLKRLAELNSVVADLLTILPNGYQWDHPAAGAWFLNEIAPQIAKLTSKWYADYVYNVLTILGESPRQEAWRVARAYAEAPVDVKLKALLRLYDDMGSETLQAMQQAFARAKRNGDTIRSSRHTYSSLRTVI